MKNKIICHVQTHQSVLITAWRRDSNTEPCKQKAAQKIQKTKVSEVNNLWSITSQIGIDLDLYRQI